MFSGPALRPGRVQAGAAAGQEAPGPSALARECVCRERSDRSQLLVFIRASGSFGIDTEPYLFFSARARLAAVLRSSFFGINASASKPELRTLSVA